MAETTVRELADVVGIPSTGCWRNLASRGFLTRSRRADQRSGEDAVVHAPAPPARQGWSRAGHATQDHPAAQVDERVEDRLAAGPPEDGGGRDARAADVRAGRRPASRHEGGCGRGRERCQGAHERREARLAGRGEAPSAGARRDPEGGSGGTGEGGGAAQVARAREEEARPHRRTRVRAGVRACRRASDRRSGDDRHPCGSRPLAGTRRQAGSAVPCRQAGSAAPLTSSRFEAWRARRRPRAWWPARARTEKP